MILLIFSAHLANSAVQTPGPSGHIGPIQTYALQHKLVDGLLSGLRNEKSFVSLHCVFERLFVVAAMVCGIDAV